MDISSDLKPSYTTDDFRKFLLSEGHATELQIACYPDTVSVLMNNDIIWRDFIETMKDLEAVEDGELESRPDWNYR